MADRARHGIPERILASIEDGIPAVQAIREWRELGIYALARRSGVPARRIGRYEAKRAPLSNAELISIAVALRVQRRCCSLRPIILVQMTCMDSNYTAREQEIFGSR